MHILLLLGAAMAGESFKPDYAANIFKVDFSTPPKVIIQLQYGRYADYTSGEAELACTKAMSAWHCRLPEGIRSDEFDEVVIVPEEKMLVAVKTDASGTRTVHPVVRMMYPGGYPMPDDEMPGMFCVDFRSFLSCTGPGCGPPPDPPSSPPPERRKRR